MKRLFLLWVLMVVGFAAAAQTPEEKLTSSNEVMVDTKNVPQQINQTPTPASNESDTKTINYQKLVVSASLITAIIILIIITIT